MNLFKKSFVGIFILSLFVNFFISSNKAEAAITVDVKVNGQSSVTVPPNTNVKITWTSTGANKCVRSDTGATIALNSNDDVNKGITVNSGTVTKGITITCSRTCSNTGMMIGESNTVSNNIRTQKFKVTELGTPGDTYSISMNHRGTFVEVAAGDTTYTIAQKLAAAINAQTDWPYFTGYDGLRQSGEPTATYLYNVVTVTFPATGTIWGGQEPGTSYAFTDIGSSGDCKPVMTWGADTVSGNVRTQKFTIGTPVTNGDKYAVSNHGQTIYVTASPTDTVSTIAQKFATAISNAVYTNWATYFGGDAPGGVTATTSSSNGVVTVNLTSAGAVAGFSTAWAEF